MGENQLRARVFDHELQSIDWIVWIERQVSSSGLQNRQQCDNRIQVSLAAETDQRSGLHTGFDHPVCQLVASRLQFSVSELLITGLKRNSIGRLFGLRINEVMQTAVERIVRAG